MQAEKEGDAAVKARLQTVLKVAMEEKQKTLRPEIQLLNRLLAVKTSAERRQARGMPLLACIAQTIRHLARSLVDCGTAGACAASPAGPHSQESEGERCMLCLFLTLVLSC